MKKTVTRTVMILVIMLLAVSSLGGIGVAAAEQVYVPVFTQNFESYTVYDRNNGTGTFGDALAGKVDNGTQSVSLADGTDGLISIGQDEVNKFVEFREKVDIASYLKFDLDQPQSGRNVVVQMDFATGNGEFHIKPTFCDENGGKTEEIVNFMQLSRKNTAYRYYYDSVTNTNKSAALTKLPNTSWYTAEIHFDMAKLTYSLYIKGLDGTLLYTYENNKLPTNDTNTQADTYGTRRYLQSIKLEATSPGGDSLAIDSLVKPVKIDDFTVSVPKAPTPKEKENQFSQDFESYTVCDKTNLAKPTGTFGTAFNQKIPGATQAAIGDNELHINGTQGLLSVQQEGNNKFFEAAVQLNILPRLSYQLDKPITGDDLLFEFDYSLGKSILYFNLEFNNETGTDPLKNESFMVLGWAGSTVYYHVANGNNGAYTLDARTGWSKAEVHINMQTLKFRIDFKDSSGTLVDCIPESPLPTPQNGTGLPEDLYGSRRYISAIEFRARCQGNALTGTDGPIYVDNISASVLKPNKTATLSVSGEGTVAIDGAALANGATTEIAANGSDLSVKPADGYEIKSVTVGDDERVIVDPSEYNETLTLTENAMITVVFEEIPPTEPSIISNKIVADSTYRPVGSENDYRSAVIYSSMVVSKDYTIKQYGVNLYRDGELLACLPGDGYSVDGRYAIRFYAIDSVIAGDYTAKAFIEFTDGTSIEEETGHDFTILPLNK